jgi:hypothetical protein
VSRWTAERWAASTGMAFAIVLLVANFIPGSPPKYNASAGKIVTYLNHHHRALTITGILEGVALVLFLWFLSSFAGYFREVGQRRLSTIIYGGGVATVAIAATGDALALGDMRLSTFLGSGAVQAIYAVTVFFYLKVFWTLTALALATVLATRRSGALPEWYAWLTLGGAVLFVLGGLSFKVHGFFSPSGAMGFIAFLALIVWVFVSSLVLVQRMPSGEGLPAPAV